MLKEQDKIFDAFFRSSNVHNVSGFGLGLSISKKIIVAHKGTLRLEKPTKEGGCNFILEFPKGESNDK